MAKLKMKTVRIIALRQDRKRLLEHLQDSGLVQLSKSDNSREGFRRVDVSSQMQVFERNVELTEQALKILEDNKSKLHELAKYLYEHETITGEEFMQILNKEPEYLPSGGSLA